MIPGAAADTLAGGPKQNKQGRIRIQKPQKPGTVEIQSCLRCHFSQSLLNSKLQQCLKRRPPEFLEWSSLLLWSVGLPYSSWTWWLCCVERYASLHPSSETWPCGWGTLPLPSTLLYTPCLTSSLDGLLVSFYCAGPTHFWLPTQAAALSSLLAVIRCL